jgi:hypothetical protein
MRTVLVTPNHQNGKGFRANWKGKESFGKTVGEAVDSLTSQFENGDDETLYIVQRFSPDEFFTAEQQKRLSELMSELHAAQDRGAQLAPEEREELEKLIEAELEGSGRRTEKLASFFL